MANKNKIIGELEIKIKEMCEKGYNAHYIAKAMGISKGTVRLWAKKNGIEIKQRLGNKIQDLKPKIIEMLKSGLTRKEIQKALKVHYTQVTEIAKEEGLDDLLRTRDVSALDKILSEEEIVSRIKDKSVYLGYNKDKKKYAFKCTETNNVFFKNIAHTKTITSPYGKSGHPLTEADYANRLKSIEHTIEPGTFIKTKGPVVVYCKNGHKRELLRASYAFKFDCANCGNNGTSKQELTVMSWILQYYPNATKFKFPERKTKPKEIDIYIPELKLGIEFCGLYYHQENDLEANNADSNKHYKKMLEANKLDIRLITIFADEWENREKQIKNFLLSAMGKNEIKIGARECEVKKIEKAQCDEFMEENHIQGKDNSAVSFGLFYKNELVGAITGGTHPHRPDKNELNFYLNRLAFKANMTIMGGASKLFAALKNYTLPYKYENIVSWSDNRWSEGDIYKQLGFTFDSEKEKGSNRGLSDGSIWPDFQYILRNKRYSRHAIEKMGLKDLELNKIYDCGKKRWIYPLW